MIIFVVEIFGEDKTGRRLIAHAKHCGGCIVGHGFDKEKSWLYTKVGIDDSTASGHSWLMDVVDSPIGVRQIRGPFSTWDEAK